MRCKSEQFGWGVHLSSGTAAVQHLHHSDRLLCEKKGRQELGMHTTSSGNLLLSSIWRVFSSRSLELTNAIIDVWSILLAILLGFFTAVLLARELRPTWLFGFYLSLGGRREVPDVALCADPPLSLSLFGWARPSPFFSRRNYRLTERSISFIFAEPLARPENGSHKLSRIVSFRVSKRLGSQSLPWSGREGFKSGITLVNFLVCQRFPTQDPHFFLSGTRTTNDFYQRLDCCASNECLSKHES